MTVDTEHYHSLAFHARGLIQTARNEKRNSMDMLTDYMDLAVSAYENAIDDLDSQNKTIERLNNHIETLELKAQLREG